MLLTVQRTFRTKIQTSFIIYVQVTVAVLGRSKAYLFVFNTFDSGFIIKGGQGSSVSIVTDYGLDGPGIESRGGARFSARPDRPWGPPSLL